MIISNFLRNRKSVREFRGKQVSFDILEDIRHDLRLAENEDTTGSVKFKLYENGNNIFSNLEGKGGYAGVMINSPHYIALIRTNNEESTIIRSGYHMEKIITVLNGKGLNTCWVSIKNIDEDLKKKVFGEYDGEIDYILAFGYEKLKNPFNTEPFSERIGVEEYVFDGEIERKSNIDDLEAKGLMDIFYYLRFAPSTKNLQPWRFLIKGNKIELFLAYRDWDNSLLVDAGIIIYYFETLANAQGINNKWKLIEVPGNDFKSEDFNYKLIGEYQL